jgi:hypothetical protein
MQGTPGISSVLLIVALFAQVEGQGQVLYNPQCASDTAHKYFEELQRAEYELNPNLDRFRHDKQAQLQFVENFRKSATQDQKRMGVPSDLSNTELQSDESIIPLSKLPTCYENRYLYNLIDQYVRRVEHARKELGLHLSAPPQFGSLPTTDVNAYTFPAPTGVNIIAFNEQLFRFDALLTLIILKTISFKTNPSNPRTTSVDTSPEVVYRAVEQDSNIRQNFVLALLEFIHVVPFGSQPLEQLFDPLAVSFGSDMEMFAVAHEYGHLIKNHRSVTARFYLDGTRDPNRSEASVPMLYRTWKQELEADDVGIRLVIRVLKDEAKHNPSARARLFFALRGALFFFNCLQIVEDAKFVKDYGKLPQATTEKEKRRVRAIAKGTKVSNAKTRIDLTRLSDHPPAWLRAERVKSIVEHTTTLPKPTAVQKRFAEIGDAMIRNTRLLWTLSSGPLPNVIDDMRNNRQR